MLETEEEAFSVNRTHYFGLGESKTIGAITEIVGVQAGPEVIAS